MGQFLTRNATLSWVALVATALAILARVYTASFGWVTAILSLVVFVAFYGLLEESRSEAGSWALGSDGQAVLVVVWVLVLVFIFLAPWESAWFHG
ncbi:MAG: hypothetical protein V4858_04365 [Pseudomonadota bacterium]